MTHSTRAVHPPVIRRHQEGIPPCSITEASCRHEPRPHSAPNTPFRANRRPTPSLTPSRGARAARRVLRRLAGERGAATAEYAVATMAAVGFAGLLVVILRGDEVRGILTDLVRNALTVG